MGRKANFVPKSKCGPGKKAKKQQDPAFNDFVPKEGKQLSHNQRKRATKRAIKAVEHSTQQAKKLKVEKKIEKTATPENEKVLFMSDDEEEEPGFFEGSGSESDDEKMPQMWKKPESDSDDSEFPDDDMSEQDNESNGDDAEQASSDEEASDLESKDGDDQSMESFDEDDISEDEESNPVVMKLVEKLQKAKQASLEISTSRPEESHKVSIHVPTFEEILKEEKESMDMQKVQNRILDTLTILNNFKKLKEDGRSRAEYLNILRHDIAQYYSYNDFLVDKFLEIIPMNEVEEFFEANERPRPTTIRANTLKVKRNHLATTLTGKGMSVEPLKWSTVGLTIFNSSVPIGATPEYLGGFYMLQGASSFLPVMTLHPQPNETILDMCAAPGGKTTHLATYMKNTGVILSNDANRKRISALESNFIRMGVHNAAAINMNGKDFGRMMPQRFDRILLDAPCSGTGVIAKDPRVKVSKSERDIKSCTHLQKELILSAIDACNAKSKTGGYIAYSTCSLLVE